MADLILNVSAPDATQVLDGLERSLNVVKSAASGLSTALGKLEEAAPKKLKQGFSEASLAMRELERGFSEMDKAFADFRPKVKEAESGLKGLSDTAKTTGQSLKKDLGDAFSGVAGMMAKSADTIEGSQEKVQQSVRRTAAAVKESSAAYDSLGMKIASISSSMGAAAGGVNTLTDAQLKLAQATREASLARATQAGVRSVGAFSGVGGLSAVEESSQAQAALAATKTLAEAQKVQLSNFLLASKEKQDAYALDMAAMRKYYQDEGALSAKRLNDSVAKFKALEAESERAANLKSNLAKNQTYTAYHTGTFSSIQGSSIGTLVGGGEVEAAKSLTAAHKELSTAKEVTASKSRDVQKEFAILGDQSRNLHSAFRGLASGFDAMWLSWGNIIPLIAGAAISHSVSEMVKSGAELEYQLTFVSQLTGGASISVERFSETTRGSVIGTKDAAEGLRALAQSGLDAQQSLAVLPDVMNLAIVGEMNMSQAALAATGIMHAFNLEVYDMGHITDVLTKAAASSNTSVGGIVEAMKSASVVADQYHLSLEEVAQSLAIVGNRNITGSAAGTSMKTFVDDLAAPSKKGADMMKQLGVEVYDSQTKQLKSLKSMIEELSVGLAGLDEQSKNVALAAIFEKRGVKFAAALLEDKDKFADGVETMMNTAQEKAAGFAAKVASELSKGVKGGMKVAANDLALVFDTAFQQTSDSWSNLVAKFDEGIKSEGFKAFVDTVSTGTIKLLENIETIAKWLAIGYEIVKVVELATASMKWFSAGLATAALGAEAVSLSAAGVTAALAGVVWPIAAVGALAAAYYYLKGSIDAVKESEERKNREANQTNEAMDKETTRILANAAAFDLAARDGITFAKAQAKLAQETDKVTVALLAQNKAKSESALSEARFAVETKYGSVTAAPREDVLALSALSKKAADDKVQYDGEIARSAERTAKVVVQSQAMELEATRKTVYEMTVTTKKLEGELDARKQRAMATGGSTESLKAMRKELEGLQNALSSVDRGDSAKLANLNSQLQTLQKTINEGDRHITPKAPKVPREQFDNTLTTIKSELAERERAIKESYDNEMKLLDLRHKGKLDSDATYMLESLQKTAEFERERNQVRDEESIKYEAEYRDRLARIEAMPDSLTKTNQKNSLDNDYIRYFDSLAASRKRGADAERYRLETVSISLETENKKVSDSVDAYIDKMNAKTAAEAAMQDARRAVAGQSAEVVAAFEAETAARSAGSSELEKWNKEMDKAGESLTEFTGLLEKKSATGVKLSTDEREALMDLIEKYQVLKNAVGKVSEANEANAKTASVNVYRKSINDQTDKLSKDITKTLADGIMSAGKDGGAGLRKAIEDVLITRPFRIVVEAMLQPISNSIAQGIMGQSIGAGAAGSTGLQTALNGAALAVSSFGSAAMETAAGVAGFSAELSSLSFTEAISTGMASVSAGSYAAGAGTMAGAAMPYVAAAIAAKSLFDSMQGSVNQTGSYLYGYNTAGGFKSGGRNDFNQSGGMFGGGNTKNSDWFDPAPQVSKYMSAVNDAVITSVKDWAKAIGLSADAVDSYNKQIEVSIGGLDAKGMKEAIDKAFAGMADDIAQVNFGDLLLPMAKEGETLGTTLQRLGTDLTTVNGILSGLNKPLFEASTRGVQDMEALLTSVGGLDKFSSLASNLEAVNNVMMDLGQTTFDLTLEGAKSASTLALSVGGADKLAALASDLIKVNENLGKLGEPLKDISVASAQAAHGMLKATEIAVKTQEATQKLEDGAASFAKKLSKDPNNTQVSSLQAIFDRAMSTVTSAIPSIQGKSGLTSVTHDQYVGYSDADRAKLDSAASAYKDLQAAIDSASKTAQDAAKTAQDTADTAAQAYADALKAVEDSTRDANREIADFGKTDLQKKLSKINYAGQDKQAELDALSSKAAELSATATAASLKATSVSLDNTDTITDSLIRYSASLSDNSKAVAANISDTLQNTTTALGDSLTLVPAIAALFAEILRGLDKIPAALQAVSSAVSGLGSASSAASGGVSSLAMAAAAAGTSAAGAVGPVNAAGGAFNAVAPAAAAAGAALNALGSSFDAAGPALSSLGSAFDAAAAALNSLTATFGAAAGALDGLNASFSAAATGLSGLSSAFESVTSSGASFAGTLGSVGGALFDISGAALSAAGGISSAVSALSAAASAASSVQTPAVDTTTVISKAGGGAIYGPGTATSDSIPAMLSNGEYVVKASSVSKYGTRFLDALNAGTFRNTIYRAPGGSVSSNVEPQTTAAYLDRFQSFVAMFGGAAATFSSASQKLKDLGYDPSKMSSADATKAALDYVNKNAPTKDSAGSYSFSKEKQDALSGLDGVLDSVNAVIDGLKEQEGWQNKLKVLTGKTTQSSIDMQDELAKATDETTKSLIKQVYAQEEKKKADEKVTGLRSTYAQMAIGDMQRRGDPALASVMQRQLDLYGADGKSGMTEGLSASGKSQVIAQYDINAKYKAQIESDTAILEAQKAAQEHYLDAIDKVTDAQKKLSSALTSTVKSFKDFLKTLDAKSATGSDLSSARQNFGTLASQAASGDTSVYEKLIPAAQEMLDLSEKYSRNLQEYRRDEANVRNVVNSVITKSQEQLDKLPNVTLEADAIKAAWQDLQKATKAQADASIILTAMGVDQADILQRRKTTEETLIKQYEDAIKLRPDYAQFQVEFNNKIAELKDVVIFPDMKDEFKLPEGVTTGSILSDRVYEILPDEFAGKRTDLAKLLSDQVLELLPDEFAGKKSDLAKLLSDKVAELLPEEFAGKKTDLAKFLSDQVLAVLPEKFAGDKSDLSKLLSDQVLTILPEKFAGDRSDLSKMLSDKVLETLPEKFAGEKTNLSKFLSDQVLAILPKEFAGEKTNLAKTLSDQVLEVIPDKFAGDSFSLAAQASTRLDGILPAGMAGASFSAAAMMQTAIDKAIASSSAAVTAAITASVPTTSTPTTNTATTGDAPTRWWSTIERVWKTTPLPSYDVGSNYVPYDMTANIHQGEEITPRPYVDAQRNDRNQTNALLAQLLRSNEELRAEIAQLRAPTQASADSNKRIANTLTRVTRDGTSLLTTPA